MPDAGSLCYECRGSGPDLLLIHGFASSLRFWDPLVAALEEDFRCWAVDLAGCGASQIAPDLPVTLKDHVQLLLGFVGVHGLKPQAILGHSMGGMLTLMLAQAAPDLAERLVLVCPTVTGKYFLGANYLVATPVMQQLLPLTRPAWERLQKDAAMPLPLPPPFVPEVVVERTRQDFHRASWGAAVSALAEMAVTSMEAALPSIQQPTLVIVGTHDEVVPPSEGRLAAQHLPHATLLEVPGGHHTPFDEMPDLTIPAVQAFLRGS